MIRKRISKQFIVYLLFSLLLIFALNHCSDNSSSLSNHHHTSTVASGSETQKQASVVFYSARSPGWRGWFTVHTWLAIKQKNDQVYTVYEVEGWRVKNGLSAIHRYQSANPARYWYGAKPHTILSIDGKQASAVIPFILDAIKRYPWKHQYATFPGPNSNTFPAWIGKQVPKLGLSMPIKAIGSGYAE